MNDRMSFQSFDRSVTASAMTAAAADPGSVTLPAVAL
jgi:hypothetical protein